MIALFLPLLCMRATPLLINGSLESADNGRPLGWIAEKWGENVKMDYAREGRGGSWCVKIQVDGTPRRSQWMQNVRGLKPYAKYRLTGWIKTAGMARGGAGFDLVDGAAPPQSGLKGSNDWQKISIDFETKAFDSARVCCFFGLGDEATGTAWFDDMDVELLSADTLKPSVTLAPGRTREPISPYIYGQFIEQMGRCVNGGGIWSELIEDRKFYYPIEKGEHLAADGKPFKAKSPWSVIGDARVRQSTDMPFVGRWSPAVEVETEGGVRQEHVGFRSNVDTVGYIWLDGAPGQPVDVRIQWGPDKGDSQSVRIEKPEAGFKKYPLKYRAKKTTEQGVVEILGSGPGTFRVGAISLMPGDNVDGMRKDVVTLLKRLDSPVYRWPGGCFVGGYDWRVGLGDRDKRAPFPNTHWAGLEANDFGMHEFMNLCQILKAEPYICVDTGPGTAQLAADEVRYCNDPQTTEMGKWRAKNGHPQPFNVKFWAVGNEMFGDWQKGYMPLNQYVTKHTEVAEAMRKADPDAVLVGVGEVGFWTERMLKDCAPTMDLISEHFYRQDWHSGGLMTHVQQIPQEIRRRVEAHRQYRKEIPGLASRNIKIAMDEWNFWYGPHIYGELGTRYFMKDALGVAAGLHEYFRQSDMVFMANYAQTVNVIGAIKTNRVAADMETTGLMLEMYRQKFGVTPIEITSDHRPLDVVAAWSKDKKSITIGVVNPTEDELAFDLTVPGIKLGKVEMTGVGGVDPMAYNSPEKPTNVVRWTKMVDLSGGSVRLPSASAVILTLPIR